MSASQSNDVHSTRAPEPVGAYPHAKRAGNLLFMSGVGPRKRGTKEIPGVTLGADIIKQKAPTHMNGYQDPALGKYGKTSNLVYTNLMTPHEIDLIRYQVLNAYAGRIGVINSGGESGKSDLADAVRLAVVNKRAGGMGLILGRKAFQKPLAEGVEILRAVQDVYLNPDVTIA